VGTVYSRDGDITELNAVKSFHRLERTNPDDYCSRCWIHTHPRFKSFMSRTDIMQLYYNACLNRNSFGIVLSPREEGVKALFVALTDFGFEKVAELTKEARQLHANELEYVKAHIRA